MAIPPSIADFQEQLKKALLRYYGPQEAPIIVSYFLAEHDLSQPDWPLLQQQAARLEAGEPIQYVIAKGHFYGRDFKVGPGVLIPRRETEELMVWVRNEAQGQNKVIRGLDIGTGTGCIPISLALEWEAKGRSSDLMGIDISVEALEIARTNAHHFEATNCQFQQLDILKANDEQFEALDFVVSNPPYVPNKEKAIIKEHVKKYEPGLALFVPDEDPLLFYRSIAERSIHWLRPGGQLFLEIHEDYGAEMQALLLSLGFQQIVLRQDLQGKDRMLKGQRPL
ncbi:MAG: peptide chain release factor N(5)-glutamine methyltransferase [Bacteroidota bacterium]